MDPVVYIALTKYVNANSYQPFGPCVNLHWKHPLPINSDQIATLTDHAGNKYIQHAFSNPNCTFPDASSLPPGWTLGVASFLNLCDPPLTITPQLIEA